MKDNFDACFELVLESEGHYVNDPRDPGGRTNLGVTQRAWEAYAGKSVTEDFMRKLTPELVKPFYRKQYWNRIKGDELPSGIDYALYDFAVNSGVSKASRTIQQIAGVYADGVIGVKSMEAIASCDPKQTIDALCDMRMDFLRSLANFSIYGKGWSARVAKVKQKAFSMTSEA